MSSIEIFENWEGHLKLGTTIEIKISQSDIWILRQQLSPLAPYHKVDR